MEWDVYGQVAHLTQHDDVKLIFPQEFRTVVELQGHFDFLGFFERDATGPLRTASPENIALLRRRQPAF